jgi:hypothetical protein
MRQHWGVRRGIVEGDDFSVLPAPVARVVTALSRIFKKSGPGGDDQTEEPTPSQERPQDPPTP